MLYGANNPILHIVGVEHMRWNKGTFEVPPREYSVLSFRIRGSATIHSGGNAYHVQPNDILYLPQNMKYTADYTDTEIIGIHFVTMYDDPEIKLYTFQNGEQIFKRFLQIQALWEQKKLGFAVYSMAQLYTILGTLLENETKAVLPTHFLNAVSFLNANYRNPNISVDMVCRETGMGATVFRQLFKKHYQKTPTEYITHFRIEKAKDLLINTDFSIGQIANLCGYENVYYFSNVFKKEIGI